MEGGGDREFLDLREEGGKGRFCYLSIRDRYPKVQVINIKLVPLSELGTSNRMTE